MVNWKIGTNQIDKITQHENVSQNEIACFLCVFFTHDKYQLTGINLQNLAKVLICGKSVTQKTFSSHVKS